MIYHNDKLGLEEYRAHVMDGITSVIVSPNYIKENIEFFNLLIYKMFQDYEYSAVDEISITKQIKILNLFLGAMITEKPSVDLPEDTVNI